MWTFEVSATFYMMPINFVGLFPWAMSCWRPEPDLGSYYTYRRHKVADAGFCPLLVEISIISSHSFDKLLHAE